MELDGKNYDAWLLSLTPVLVYHGMYKASISAVASEATDRCWGFIAASMGTVSLNRLAIQIHEKAAATTPPGNSAKILLEGLEKQHRGGLQVKLVQLVRDIGDARYDPDIDSMAAYLDRMRSRGEDLERLGEKLSPIYLAQAALRGLPAHLPGPGYPLDR